MPGIGLRQRRRSWLAGLACLSLAGYGAYHEAHADMTGSPAPETQALKLGPTSALSVMWVGHSLMEHKVSSSWGTVDLMSVVGRFAQSRKLTYAMTDHTLFGSPLSALWRGSPHSFARDAIEMVAKREAFEREAKSYNAIVLTEALPLSGTMKAEYSAYYLRRFYCTLLQANPKARVYLYQTWVNFQGSDGKGAADGFDWSSEMKAEGKLWNELAETARKPSVAAPHWLNVLGWSPQSDGGCSHQDPIYIVPVGDAMLKLAGRVSAPGADETFVWPDGRSFKMTDLVENPMVNSADGATALRDPARPMDDIHASLAGVYFAALVNFATLYRQTPVGLPSPSEIGDGLAKSLQCVAWESVVDDPRAGVAGDARC